MINKNHSETVELSSNDSNSNLVKDIKIENEQK
jgi:hypothetical protein